MQSKNLLSIDNILNLFNGDKVEFTNKLRLVFNIIEYSYDGIYITDGKVNTIMVNKAYEKITGLKRQQMIGKNME